jgi:hypothetical protein
MSKSKSIASDIMDIYQRFDNKQGVAIDPITVIMITSVVIECIKMIKECQKTTHEALCMVNKLSDRHDKVLKRQLRKKMGFVKYHLFGKKYLRAFRYAARKIKIKDMVELYEEVK